MEFLSDLHPVVVHFPIAFFILYIVLELINIYLDSNQLKINSLIVLFIGVIFGILSVLTGNQAYQELLNNSSITQFHFMLIEKHEYYASLTIWYFVAILISKFYLLVKKKNAARIKYLFVIFVIVGAILIYKTASKGGDLVHNYGIGTNLLK